MTSPPDLPYRDLFEASEVGYLVTTPALIMIGANAAYLRGVGQPLHALVGHDVFEVFGNNPERPDVDQAAMVRASMARAVASGVTDRLLTVRYDIPAPDGGFEIRWWNITNTPVADASGTVTHLLHYTDDITALIVEREAGEAALEVNEELQHRIIAAQADLIARAAELTALNARLRMSSEHDRSVAAALQRAMLTELPAPGHATLTARYLTAAVDDEVGGDWYDAVILQDGAVMVVIGDVLGHDIAAAAIMGQLRSMLRALAWDRAASPAATLSRLDRAMHDLRINSMASVLLAVIDPPDAEAAHATRSITWSNGGHPPPMLVSADGNVRTLDGAATDVLLGVAAERPRHDHRDRLPAGSSLLLYTDGLVETRGADLDDGLFRLADALARHHGAPDGGLLDAVLHDMVGDHPGDDVAALLLRLEPDAPHVPGGAGSGTTGPSTGEFRVASDPH